MAFRKFRHDTYYSNFYGYWQFVDIIGLSNGVSRDDLVYVAYTNADNDMVYAINEKGKPVAFHKTNITKDYFVRPSYRYHKKCKRRVSECQKCRMYRFKKTVKKFKDKRINPRPCGLTLTLF